MRQDKRRVRFQLTWPACGSAGEGVDLKDRREPRGYFCLAAGQGWDILAACKAQGARGTVLPSRFSGAHRRSRLSGEPWPTEPYCLAARGGRLAAGVLLGRSAWTFFKVRTATGFHQAGRNEWFGLQVKVLYEKKTVLTTEAGPTAVWRPRPAASRGSPHARGRSTCLCGQWFPWKRR